MESEHDTASADTAFLETLMFEMKKVIVGQDRALERMLACLLANGHCLLESVPGLAKTLSVETMATSVGGTFSRIQFTPDLLPADVIGTRIYRASTETFDVELGPVFANFVLADEINRAPAKVQSALLEVMAERQVTIGGATHPVGAPFLVLATQNPIESEGVYPLPEAQRDRFMMQVSLGYPDRAAEVAMLDAYEAHDPLESLLPVADALTLRRLQHTTRSIHASENVKRYIVDIVSATRREPLLRLGASPRSSVHLLQAAKALSLLKGRDHVLPDDVQSLVPAVLAHRVLLSTEAHLDRRSATAVVSDVVARVPVS